MPEAGTRIADRYELVSPLGEGGMGVVWRARDTRLGRSVALKLLPGSAIGNEVARARLIREARAAAALEHDGVVHVYDVGETPDGGAFLVMELIRGKSFRDLLIADTLPFAKRALVIVKAARALAFAHASGIVHRDVKPDNIMVREDGRVIVVDFGIAKPVESALAAHADTVAQTQGKSLTGEGQLVGTPAYLSPEQARGSGVGPATDQFALAVTAFEAFTGRLPWRGGSAIEVVASLLRDDPPSASGLCGCPAEVDAVLAKALAKEPGDRHADLGAFADALEDAAGITSTTSARELQAAIPFSERDAPTESSPNATTLEPPASRPKKTKSVPPAAAQSADAKVITSTKISAPMNVAAEPEPKPRRTSPLAIVAAAAVLAGSGWLVVSSAKSSRDAAKPVPSEAPAAVAPPTIACPPFAVAPGEEPWLGVPAAVFACERAQLAHGGADARTLAPAELADAPFDTASNVKMPALDAPGARDHAVDAAKHRASQWLDGRIQRQTNGFSVDLTLRRTDGSAIAHGAGRATEIYEAVRDAIVPIVAAQPPTTAELTMLHEALDVGSVEEAFALDDIRTGIVVEDLLSLRDACTAFDRRPGTAPRVRYLARLVCARKLRTEPPAEAPPPVDESSPAALVTTILAQGTTGGADAVHARAQRLDRAREEATQPETKARLAAAASDILYLIGDARAAELARASVHASPKAWDWRTSAWHRVAFSSSGDLASQSVVVAWQPWEPVSQTFTMPDAAHVITEALPMFRRAYLLSQRGYYANQWGQALLRHGQVDAAKDVAAGSDDDHLRVNILLAEGKIKEALETATARIEKLPADDANAALAFRLANLGAVAALTLGRPTPWVDDLVKRYVESEPPHVVDGVVPFLALLSACTTAPKPIAQRCVARIQALRDAHRIPTIFSGADAVVVGAQRYVVGDYAGAAKSWRTMLRAPVWIQEGLRNAMGDAFDHAGEPEIGDEIDSGSVALIDQGAPADLAWVRAARRAAKRGDKERARKIAQAAIDRWRYADEDIPAVRELRDLLAKLGN